MGAPPFTKRLGWHQPAHIGGPRKGASNQSNPSGYGSNCLTRQEPDRRFESSFPFARVPFLGLFLTHSHVCGPPYVLFEANLKDVSLKPGEGSGHPTFRARHLQRPLLPWRKHGLIKRSILESPRSLKKRLLPKITGSWTHV